MARLDKHKAKDPFLSAYHGDMPAFNSPNFWAWCRKIGQSIDGVFGRNSMHSSDFSHIIEKICDGSIAEWEVESKIKQKLEEMFVGINSHWPDEDHIPMVPSGQVFVVHGRDNNARGMVSDFLRGLDLEPIVLQEQANAGRTIIEKFEHFSHVGFAVVLFTPDDVGGLADAPTQSSFRARQNVIFELGYFIAQMSRSRVCVLHKGSVEIPSDYSGVLYITLDDDGDWQSELKRELENAGMI